MQTSPKGVAFIAAHEGVVTHAYRDVAGVWTIGVGHTAAAGPPAPARGMTIGRAEAMRLLAADLPGYERRVGRALPGIPQHAFDGAVSFDFNTGAIERASWVTAYRAGRVADARAGLMLWTKAGGRKVDGLVRRRTAEAGLIFGGDYGGAVALAPADAAAYADRLAALGFPGAGAVLAYQKAHPDLTADGVLGPATRAQIDRDTTARAALRNLGAGGVLGMGGAAAGIPWWAALALVAAFAAAVVLVGWRYRDELLRMFRPKGVAA